MGVSEELYFSTPIYAGLVAEADELNPMLLGLAYAEREADRQGTERSVYRALNGWHSQVSLHRDPRFTPVVAAIERELEHVSTDSGYDPAWRLAIDSMWVIINGPGGSNQTHIHPKCLWSGVYYVQTPPRCGDIEFTDPRTPMLMDPPRYRPNTTKKRSRWTKVTFTPSPGKLVVFPSWLYHGVSPNLASATGDDADRVIVSFNAVQRRQQKSS